MKKEIIIGYIVLIIVATTTIGLWMARLIESNKCSWETIEQSRGEGYRKGYIKGWIDNQENNNFDDKYKINL